MLQSSPTLQPIGCSLPGSSVNGNLPCPPPGDLTHPGIKARSPSSPALAGVVCFLLTTLLANWACMTFQGGRPLPRCEGSIFPVLQDEGWEENSLASALLKVNLLFFFNSDTSQIHPFSSHCHQWEIPWTVAAIWGPQGASAPEDRRWQEAGFVYSLAALPLDLLWLEKMNAFNVWVTLILLLNLLLIY